MNPKLIAFSRLLHSEDTEFIETHTDQMMVHIVKIHSGTACEDCDRSFLLLFLFLPGQKNSTTHHVIF